MSPTLLSTIDIKLMQLIAREKCTYLFKVQTPAVCTEPVSDATTGASVPKDEL